MGRILYHERREHFDISATGHECVTQYAEVEVRSWTCDRMTPDVVIEARVMVDSKIVVNERKAYSHGEADSVFIRKGIGLFDGLVAAHPLFSQQDLDAGKEENGDRENGPSWEG